VIAVVLGLLAPFLAFALNQPANCPVTGTLRIETVSTAEVSAIATVDSSDPACRELVRSEPFLIITSARGTEELSLTPSGDEFLGQFTRPPEPWTATLYVVGSGDAVATVQSGTPSLVDLVWPALQRSPGVLIILGLAVSLGVLAVAGMPRRRVVKRGLRGSARNALPPAPEPQAEVAPLLTQVDDLAAPPLLAAEVLGTAPGEEVGGEKAGEREEGGQHADEGIAVEGDVGDDGKDDTDGHELPGSTKPPPK
jgi:hypothetical protein